MEVNKKYKLAALGGTFDRFHNGHKELLETAFNLAQKLIIGITSQTMIKNKKLSRLILPFKKRSFVVEKFLKQKNWFKRAKVIRLDSFKDGVDSTKDLEVLVVTPSNISNAKVINKLRRQKGLRKLDIVSCPLVACSDGKYLSSTRLRLGEINREGMVFADFAKNNFGRFLPVNLRQVLRKPLGRFYPLTNNKERLVNEVRKKVKRSLFSICVGDYTTGFFNQNKIDFDISVIDLHIGRKKIYDNISQLGFGKKQKVYKMKNQAGQINPQLHSLFSKIYAYSFMKKNRKVLLIKGEEDLLVLPAVLFAPLESIVFYGQPNFGYQKTDTNMGIVAIRVSEEKKKEIFEILQKFE